MNVEVFESLGEAVEHFEEKDPSKGEQHVLDMVNCQHRANLRGAARSTMGGEPRREGEGKDKEVAYDKAKLDALLDKLGIKGMEF